MKTLRQNCITLMLLLLCTGLRAQQQYPAINRLLQQFDWYTKSKSSSLLYVHFDKTLYTNNEQVWFTGYLLESNIAIARHHTMAVALVNDDSRKVALEEKFVMDAGLGFGSLVLPDSIPPGNYHFMVYTNVLDAGNKPYAVFTQPVIIKTTAEFGFNTTLRLLDTARSHVGPVRVAVNVVGKDTRPVQAAEISYTLGRDKPLKTKTGPSGEAIIVIPKVSAGLLQAQIKVNKETQSLNLQLPRYEPRPSVRFYPEGGNLVAGLVNTVGWEARTAYGQPMRITGVLYMDSNPIDTISTTAYGMGRFRLLPKVGARYYFKPLSGTTSDSSYNLPQVLAGLPIITLPDAIVNDTLRIQVVSVRPQKIVVLVHNYEQVHAQTEHVISAKRLVLKLALQAIPKGLNTITVLDTAGRPLAERLFFAHFDKRQTINIKTDRQEYITRQKVTLKLKLPPGIAADTIKGIVSVACVQDNRIEAAKQTDIETYSYLNHELANIPLNPFGRVFNDKTFLENVLLVRGWRRYTWQDVYAATQTDTAKVSSPRFSGTVKYFDTAITKPMVVGIMRDSLFGVVNTNAKGSFELNAGQITTKYGKKVGLFVNAPNQGYYNFLVNDPYKEISRTAGEHEDFENLQFGLSEQSSASQKLSSIQRVIALREVVIKAQKDNSLYGTRGFGSNECGDYVCIANILNCENHVADINNHPPLQGRSYYSRERRGMMVYLGCVAGPPKQLFTYINPIYTAREFYPPDYSEYNPPQPEYFSTIMWSHAVKLSSAGDAELTFYISDITGKYRIVVQGITSNGVAFSEASFMVKKP